MTIGVIRSALVVTVDTGETQPGDIVVEDGRIREIVGQWQGPEDWSLSAGGLYAIPGLIDLHVHVTPHSASLHESAEMPSSLIALESRIRLENMLRRGFTTVRDAGGADFGLAQAIERRLVLGPRLFPCGRALSQTGGHGDFRGRYADSQDACGCGLHRGLGSISRIADGPDAVRQAARDELRRGATQLKLMVSGGAASPVDPIETVQYSDEEIRAAVVEAEHWNTYVMAHAYTPSAIERAARLGVRSIEHASLVDQATADGLRDVGAVAVPTLAIFDALSRRGPEFGFSAGGMAKVNLIRAAAEQGIERLKSAGVPIGFGTDLLGDLQSEQCGEFLLRREVQTPIELLQSATSVAASIMNRKDELGVIAPDARADVLLVDRDPLGTADVLGESEHHLEYVIKDGDVMLRRGSIVTSV